jgi:hypothetical protein
MRCDAMQWQSQFKEVDDGECEYEGIWDGECNGSVN